MLLPIGHEDATVRRQPWVSYGLIAFNVLVYLATATVFNDQAQLGEIAQRAAEVERYIAEHPYLEPPDALRPYLDDEFLAQLEAARQRYASEGTIPEGESLAQQQEELDGLVREMMAARDRLPFQRLGYVPARGGALTALTCMFVHGGLVHLLGNMLFLFLSGPFVEDVFGRPLFGALYLLSGFAGTAAHALAFRTSQVPVIGASGAIAGVMGAFLIRLGAQKIRFLYMPFFPFFWRVRFTFFLPAFVVLPLWFAEQLWYAKTSGGESGVGFWAHVGGFLFGAAAAAAIKIFQVEERYIHPAIEKEISLVQHPGLEAALDARTRGDWDSARSEIRKVLAAEPANVDAWTEAYEIELAAGNAAEAGRHASRALDLHVRHGETDLAFHLIRDAQERAGDGLPPRFLMAAAALLEREGDGRAALDLYERVAQQAPTDPASLRALFRRGEILRKGGDLKGAREAYDRARVHPAWNEQMQDAVARALAEAERGRTPQ